MLTVSQLARKCGLSRTTLLYYESIGLMPAPQRSRSNYRRYGESDVNRLQQIRAYRDAGLNLSDIRVILDRPGDNAFGVLKRRLMELDVEIGTLRSHQQAILTLLRDKQFRRAKMITKEKWISIMKSAGVSTVQMQRWHSEFERAAPKEHQEFLEFLHLTPEEIQSIREESRLSS
jgi:DNA-binding transcriptional MerR regulator